jgi:putative protein kinase ArgK-like GTPase of G3E family
LIGGGHLNASSFIIPRATFEKWILPTAATETKDVSSSSSISTSPQAKRARTENARVVIGITGGIASGKSSISARLAALGCHVIDAGTHFISSFWLSSHVH